tara:strand:- start:564 stop:770 length:207 start_codon:yes stop_codon:yes gene_type:complete
LRTKAEIDAREKLSRGIPECTCCHVHTTWRNKPLAKHEVTIEMIASLNTQYRSLYNQIVEIKKEVNGK